MARKLGKRYKKKKKPKPSKAQVMAMAKAKLEALKEKILARIRAKASAKGGRGHEEADEGLVEKLHDSLKIRDEDQKRKLERLFAGTKGRLLKFFSAWRTGARRCRLEKTVAEREDSWRASCNCGKGDHEGCMAADRLEPVTFQMPYDVASKTGQSFFRGLYTTSRDLLQHTVVGKLRSVIRASRNFMAAHEESDAERAPSRSSAISRSSSAPTLPPIERRAAGVGLDTPTSKNSPERREPLPFLSVPGVPVFHAASGRRCVMDPVLMRMRFTDEDKVPEELKPTKWPTGIKQVHMGQEETILPPRVQAPISII